jgi:hypothetical protein
MNDAEEKLIHAIAELQHVAADAIFPDGSAG